MFHSIRFRLTLWYTVIVAVTFTVAFFTMEEYERRALSSSLNESVTNEVMWVASCMKKRSERKEGDQEIRGELFDHASFYPAKEFVEVWDSAGALFYRSPNLGDDTLARSCPAKADSGLTDVSGFREYDIRIARHRNANGTFFVAMPTVGITRPIEHLLQEFLWLLPGVILLAAVGGSYLAKRSFAKMNRVITTAQSITADRLAERIPAHAARDEVGRIISTFNEMISRLEVSFGQMKQFTADASHELRTPLTVMRSQLETALAEGVSHDELRAIIANSLDEVMRMSSIIENLLLLARADAGQNDIRRDRVDLRTLVCQTYEEAIVLASPMSLIVSLDGADEATVVGDEQRLRQLLLNLIDNAIKYNRDHGTIQMELRAEDGSARLSVTDSGIGIPAEAVPRIFDRFYRVDRARSRELGGAGLGLSIAKWIVQAHGGTISVVSEVNQGSVFTVMLPLAGRA